MQYLLHDLIKLPMAERLSIIEMALCSGNYSDYEQEIKRLISVVSEENNNTIQSSQY